LASTERKAGCRARIECLRIVGGTIDPARAPAIVGTGGHGEIQAAQFLEAEHTVRVGDAVEANAVVEEARRLQAGLLGGGDTGEGHIRAVFGIECLGIAIEGITGLELLLAHGRHEFRIFRGQARDFLGAAHGRFQRLGVELVAGG
jgi:hypothetical protein